MGIFVAMALGVALGATVFPPRWLGANSTLTLVSTGLLIACMGADLGARDSFVSDLAVLGFSSVVLCAASVVLSTAIVYFLTGAFMKDIVGRHQRERAEKAASTAGEGLPRGSDESGEALSSGLNSEMVMIAVAVASLAAGVLYGVSPLDIAPVNAVVSRADVVLYALMFFVGISVGSSKGLLAKLREYGFRVLLVPAGILLGSFLAGVACAPACGLTWAEGAAVTSGMGWYSLSGVMLADIAGARVGSIAFLANLMRELTAFLTMPWIARHLNYPTCLAPAGATSEDTTLPMLIRCTNEETVVLGVINGIACSACVPVVIAACSCFM